MNKLIVLFSVFVSIMLVIHIVSIHAEESEARKKAKAREEQIAKDADNKKIKTLNDEKKALDAKSILAKTKEPKGKAATESANATFLKARSDAETAYKNAKSALDAAKKALRIDSANSTRQTDYDNAKKTLAKAEIDLKLVNVGR